jgi:hypothetical protein
MWGGMFFSCSRRGICDYLTSRGGSYTFITWLEHHGQSARGGGDIWLGNVESFCDTRRKPSRGTISHVGHPPTLRWTLNGAIPTEHSNEDSLSRLDRKERNTTTTNTVTWYRPNPVHLRWHLTLGMLKNKSASFR